MGVSTAALASVTDVGRALAGSDTYRWGMPDEGLHRAPVVGLFDLPRFTATQPLDPGDVYVTTLEDLIAFAELPAGDVEEIRQAWTAVLGLASVNRILRLLGYVPMRVKIPALGGPMTYSPHGRITVEGHFGASGTVALERFSFGMSYDVVGPDVGAMPAELPQATLQTIADLWRERWVELNGPLNVTAEAWMTGVSYGRVEAAGTITGNKYQRASVTPGAGGTSMARHSFQTACVVTLDAQGPRGGRFGRFYLPALGEQTTLGSWTATDVAGTAAAVRDTLASVNTVLNTGLGAEVELVVASARGTGENRPVRELRVGRVPDTMRSRRRDLDEAFEVVPFQTVA